MFATFIYNGRGPHLALTATAAHAADGWPHTCTDNCAQLDISFKPPAPNLLSIMFLFQPGESRMWTCSSTQLWFSPPGH